MTKIEAFLAKQIYSKIALSKVLGLNKDISEGLVFRTIIYLIVVAYHVGKGTDTDQVRYTTGVGKKELERMTKLVETVVKEVRVDGNRRNISGARRKMLKRAFEVSFGRFIQ